MQQESAPSITTLGDYLGWARQAFLQADLFYGHGTDNAWDEAVAIALFVLNLPSDIDQSIVERVLELEEKKQLIQIAQERINTRKPLPYLLGVAWFAGEQYFVNEDVIIPRSPFAELILNRFQPWMTHAPRNILDLCTGSGCIAIACQKAFPEAGLTAVDISASALAVAKKNRALHDVAKIQLIQSDLFQTIDQQYDLIVTNPPYVGQNERDDLPMEFRHEPELALFSEEEGLAIPIAILQQAADYLTEDGLLFLEVGYNWPALEAAFLHVPFTWVEFAYGGEGICVFRRAELIQYFKPSL